MFRRTKNWIVDRLALRPLKSYALDRRVPKTPWYYGDGATLTALLGVLVLTGMVLTLTYSPAADSAYESVRYLTERQTLGAFVRALHYWCAGLMVVMLFFHLFRQILVAGYKSPREATWLFGVFLFALVLLMSYSGYTLRWDERAVYAIKVGLQTLERVPLFGESLVRFAQGGDDIGPRTLTRFYALHVIVVPLLIFALVGYHLYLVIHHGVTAPAERRQPIRSVDEQRELYHAEAESKERGEWFFPTTMFHSGLMANAVLVLAVLLALFVGPAPLGAEANLTEAAQPQEEWWFWWYSALLAILPPEIAPTFTVLFPVVVFVGLLLLPFVDRSPKRGMRSRPAFVVGVVVTVLLLLYLTDLRRRSPWTGTPAAAPPPVPANVALNDVAEQGRRLFAAYGCNSCHPVAGVGPRIGPDLAQVERRYSPDEIRKYVVAPPEGVAMPSYAGRLSAEDLDRIVEYVHVAQTFPRRP